MVVENRMYQEQQEICRGEILSQKRLSGKFGRSILCIPKNRLLLYPCAIAVVPNREGIPPQGAIS